MRRWLCAMQALRHAPHQQASVQERVRSRTDQPFERRDAAEKAAAVNRQPFDRCRVPLPRALCINSRNRAPG